MKTNRIYRPKERRNFDDVIEDKKDLIDKMSKMELNDCREKLKVKLDDLTNEIKNKKYSEGKIKYLKGQRMITTSLLSYMKERIKLINVVIHNGSSKDFASKFVENAASILPMNLFQKIYRLTLTSQDFQNQTIELVKQFMLESIHKLNINENRKD